ncbi:MAG TPA: hypothetical protein H9670_00840 [Firmicutes bacterium]|nr:hypothetical protein [Bacillota bacterium]
MAFDPKKFRRRSLTALTLALSASLTLGVLAACTTPDNTTEDEEEETTSQTDTQKIRNGNFEFYSEMDVEDKKEKLDLISSPTSWSFTSGSPTSDTTSGIIDTTEWNYLSASGRALTSVEDAYAHWNDDEVTAYDRLKFLDEFEDEIDDLDSDSAEAKLFDEFTYSIDYEDVEYLSEISKAPTPRTDAAEGETGVLMIHNRRTSNKVLGTGQYYTSSTSISLDAGTSAKVSVWVRTDDLTHYSSENEETAVLGNAGAYIRINQTVGGTTLKSVYIENISTNGEWKEFTIYVRANSFTSTSFTVVLGLGQGSSDNPLYYVNGYAFFDDVSCEVLPSADFDDATATGICNLDDIANDAKRFEGKTFSSVKIDLDADLGSADDLAITNGDAAITKDPNGGKSNVVYNGPYADDYAKTVTAAELLTATASNSYLKNIYDTDFAGSFPFANADENMTVVMLMSVSSAPYTATSDVYTLGAKQHMIVSFWVKTSKIGGTGASATLVDGENRTQIAAFDSTTVATVDIDDETKDIYNGWVQCFFFVSNETDSEKQFTIEFSYGPTDVASAEQTAYDDGYAAFTNFEILADVNAKYIDYASTDSYAVKATLTGAVDNDSAFDQAGVDTNRDIRNTLAPTANFTAVPNASKSIVTSGVENTDPTTYGLYTGLLNAKYAANYSAVSDSAAWSGALTALADSNSYTDSSLSEAELWWAKIFGDYNADDTRASSRVANQPLVVLNTSSEAVNSYGFLSGSLSVAASSYQRISMRVKLSEGATATFYLIDTSDVKKGYNDPLTPTLPTVTFWYDDNGNIVKGDPTASGFNSRTDVLFYRADNGLYYKADGDTSIYYANLKNYTADEATGDLLAVDAEGNTTIAFYCNEGKYYAYRTETSRGQYEYSQEVLDLYDSLTDEQKADPDYVRYNYVASDMNNYASVITVKGTAENAGKWVDVTFYVHTGNTAKNYRLEVWAGSRDFTVAEDGTVSQTGTKIPANSYFFFDNYTSTDVSGNYDALLSETVDDLKDAHNVATDENLPSDYALYYTYTFYDAKDFLRYDKSLDEEELGNPYGSYKQSAYSEGIAWLLSETDEGTTLFLDFAATDVTVEADDLTSDDDTTTDTDETPAGETNVWLIISSGVLAFALVFAIVAIIVRRVHKKIGKNAKVKPAKDTRIKPKKAAPEKPVQPEQPKDENDPYNE